MHIIISLLLLLTTSYSISALPANEDALINQLRADEDALINQLTSELTIKVYDERTLLFAAITGDLNTVNECLEKGVNVNCNICFKVTPLMLAAERGHTKCVEVLLAEPSCAVNHVGTDEQGYTLSALMQASYKNHPEIVKLLLQKKANVRFENSFGATPLLQAAQDGHKEVVEALLASGSDANFQIVQSKIPDLIGKTALHQAAQSNHLAIIALLLKYGALANPIDSQKKESPLMCAVKNNLLLASSLLLEADPPADVNYQADYNDKSTALEKAVVFENPKIVRLLLKHGADPSIQNAYGYTPLHIAEVNEFKEMISILKEHMTLPEYE